MKVTSVIIKKEGENKNGPWKMFEVTLDNGTKATGFEIVHVGEEVFTHQDGKYLNYSKAEGSQRQPVHPAAPISNGSILDQRQRAIIRQHSQSMALEVLKLKVQLNELSIEDLTPAKLTKLAEYFDSDVLGVSQ